MANQAIALQARAPQTDILGPSMARNAQMINMMMQQRAAERQAAQAQQQMQLAQTKEAREARASDLEYQVNAAKFFRQLGKAVGDDATYQAWLSRVEKISPEDAAAYRAFSPNYDPGKMDQIIMDVEQYINKKIATPVASVTMDPEGRAFNTVAGGSPGVAGAFPMQQYEMDPNAAPGATPQAGAAPTPPKLRQPTPVSPEVLDAAAAAIAEGKDLSDPRLKALPPDAFDKAQKRAMRLRLDTMPPVEGAMQPMSAQQGQPDLAQVVNDMMATGFVTQSNLEAMRQVAGPDKDAQLAEILRSNNIQILPDEGAEQFRSAVYRPEEGAATLQRGAPDATLEEAQYVPTGRQFKGKSPMQSPVPGSAIVPLPRVAAEARAQRETPAEAAAKAKATKAAEAEVARTTEEAKKLPAKRQVSTIISKIRNAYEQLDKASAIPSERRGGVANFFDYLATTSGGREVQKMFGTKESKLLTEIVSSRKLLATAIKNATGMSAQEMNSNVELQLTLDALTDPTQGYEAAISTLGTLEELYGAPKGQAPRGGGQRKETQRGSNIDALLKKYGG